ncbi:helix-turn-helix transcriptional regulator [Listeria sp. FSL L7-1517]|uniref:winged helix-turn-helix transcriptional regulator n=1 Tax=Listeria immobilis TaxID=2713502 RepID=UPI00164D1454|nr:helix-turn-helix domain-containing protein [Listeria immobilis]MBC6297374.1 helix-turn-helix transcriptional regulator [Listeria immobilis]
MNREKIFNCPVEAPISFIGGKYKAIILHHLTNHTLRFNELQKLVSKATPKMLTQQLRELERDGLISRKVYPVVPPKTEYALTDFGRSLTPILKALCDWGTIYIENDCTWIATNPS